jgi:hypothetical protein
MLHFRSSRRSPHCSYDLYLCLAVTYKIGKTRSRTKLNQTVEYIQTLNAKPITAEGFMCKGQFYSIPYSLP